LQRAGWKELDSCTELQRLRLTGPQEPDQQGRDRNPAQHVEIGQREDQNLQHSREQDKKPGTLVNLGHISRIAKCWLQASGFRSAVTRLLTNSTISVVTYSGG
jgi:hypothetical protein